jgi:hypothetical protein
MIHGLTAVLPRLIIVLFVGERNVVLRWLVLLLCVDYALLNVCSETVECLVDIDISLCRNFKEGDAELVSECLAFFCRHGTLLFPIALVTYENLVDAFGSVLLHVGKPSAYVCEVYHISLGWTLNKAC